MNVLACFAQSHMPRHASCSSSSATQSSRERLANGSFSAAVRKRSNSFCFGDFGGDFDTLACSQHHTAT